MGAGPHARDQLILAEEFARPFEQSHEELKGAAAQANRLALFQQELVQTLADGDPALLGGSA